MPDRMAARLDDEKPVGGSRHDATIEVGRHHDELVRHPAVRLRDGRQSLRAVRSTTLAPKFGDEPDTVAVAGTPRLAQGEWTRPDPFRCREVGACRWLVCR